MDFGRLSRGVVALVGAAVVLPNPSLRAQDLGGLFTSEGIEVRADHRVFTLFALFNALGYDQEPARGPIPLAAPLYHPLRLRARQRLCGPLQGLEEAKALLAAHPRPLSEYVDRALSLGAAPGFEVPAGVQDEELVALSRALSAFDKLIAAELYGSLQEEMRAEAKRVVDVLDRLSTEAKKLLRVKGEPGALEEESEELDAGVRLVLILNPLGALSSQYWGAHGDAQYLVLGIPPEEASSTRHFEAAVLLGLLTTHCGALLSQVPPAPLERLAGAAVSGQVDLARAQSMVLWALARQFSAAGSTTVDPALVGPVPPPALERAAATTVAWYRRQQAPLEKLAPELCGRTVGVPIRAPQRKSTP